MPTEKDGSAEALTAHLQRMSDSVEQISARIARLATVLDIDLQSDSEINLLLNGQQRHLPDLAEVKFDRAVAVKDAGGTTAGFQGYGTRPFQKHAPPGPSRDVLF